MLNTIRWILQRRFIRIHSVKSSGNFVLSILGCSWDCSFTTIYIWMVFISILVSGSTGCCYFADKRNSMVCGQWLVCNVKGAICYYPENFGLERLQCFGIGWLKIIQCLSPYAGTKIVLYRSNLLINRKLWSNAY